MSGFGLFLGNYVRRGFSYRWIVLVPTVMVFALVTLYVTIQPDSYESSARLMQPIASSSDRATRADNRSIAKDMFRSASERLLSNRVLTQVIEKTDPYPTLRQTRGMDAAVERLRDKVRIDINRATGSISITCSHSKGDNPAEMAANIVNTLTDLFIRAQREALEDQVTKHKMFLDREKTRSRKEFETAQNLLEEFKSRHVGELPDDKQANEARIDRLTRDVLDYRGQQRAHEANIAGINREIARLDADLALAMENGPIDIARAIRAGEDRLNGLKLALKDTLFTYSPDNEIVKRIENQIKARQKLNDELRSSERRVSTKKREELIRYLIDESRTWRTRLSEERKTIDGQIADTRKKIEAARKRIETGAKIDGEYLSLQRSVTEAMNRYDHLVARHDDAEQRARLDNYASEVPIQVEQSAFVPAKPASPDRLVTSLMGLVLGLGIGVGLAIARHKLDRSYHRPDDLRALLPGAVLVTVPEVRKGGTRVGVMILGVLGGLVLAGVFTATVAVLGVQVGWWGEPDMIRALMNLR